MISRQVLDTFQSLSVLWIFVINSTLVLLAFFFNILYSFPLFLLHSLTDGTSCIILILLVCPCTACSGKVPCIRDRHGQTDVSVWFPAVWFFSGQTLAMETSPADWSTKSKYETQPRQRLPLKRRHFRRTLHRLQPDIGV